MKAIHIKSKSIIVFLFAILLTVGAGYRLEAQFFYEESCRNATGAFTPLGDAVYTAREAGEDLPGSGWLRLTSSSGKYNNTGYVLLPESYPSNLGLTIEFDFKVWGWGNSDPFLDALADGFSIFLFDAAVTNFELGYSGASLGYLPLYGYPPHNGLTGAYLGVLFDEYGRTAHYVRGGDDESTDLPLPLYPNLITIAGPAITTGNAGSFTSLKGPENMGYQLIGDNGLNNDYLPTISRKVNNNGPRPADDSYYRRLRVQIDPANPNDPNSNRRTGMNVSVYLKTNNTTGQFTRIIGPTNVPSTAPSLLRLGFAGTTGIRFAYHEIRDVYIKTSGDLSVYKNTDLTDCVHNNDIVNITTIISNGDNSKLFGVAVQDTIPAGFDLISSPAQPVLSGGGSFVGTPPTYTYTTLPDGRRVYSYSLNINEVGTVYIKYSGKISNAAIVNSLSSSAGITTLPKVGSTSGSTLQDGNLDDNYAKIEIPFTHDYGDAPASYGQAVHIFFDCLKLGDWTADKKPALSDEISIDADADGNDDAVVIPLDEDGFVDLSSEKFEFDNNDLKVKVSVHNSSGNNAILIGWIDFNHDGVFDAAEASSTVTVNANTTTPATVDLQWTGVNAKMRNGATYMRLRISTDNNLTAAKSQGLLFNGEVEDYKLNFDILEVSKTAVSNNHYDTSHAMIGDTITYTINVTNKVQGDVMVFDPIPLGTEYVDGSASNSGTLTNVDSYGASNVPAIKWEPVSAGNSLTFKARLTSYPAGVDSVFNIAYAVMNGDTIPSTGKTGDMTIITIDVFRANNDMVSVLRNTPLTIDALANDEYPPYCTPALTILEGSYNSFGVATVATGQILYTPAAGQYGVDSVLYQLECEGRITTAKMCVIISNPFSRQYVACPDASSTMGFDAISEVTYHWYDAETGGVIVTDEDSQDTLTIIKNTTADIGTWWVEPRYGNFVFPRHRVELKPGDNCGVTVPQGCATTGTIIWKEDFGGNAPGFLQRALDPGWQTSGKTSYSYVTRKDYLLPAVNQYGLLKSINGYSNHDWAHSYLDDHTSWGNQNSGYFLTFDANSSAGDFYKFDIDELCAGKELSFSAWLMNINLPGTSVLPNVQFVIEDMGGIVLSRFNTGDIVVTAGPLWVNYSFNFIVPAGINHLKVRFINNVTAGNDIGNDISIDDIEVRLCAPPVTTNITDNDTVVCFGNALDITGTFTEDCTFGNDLAYRWEFRHADSSSWKTLEQDDVTVDCTAADPADRTITKTLSITSATKAGEGYYRMLGSAAANIGSVNCRAASDSVYVRIIDDRFVAPDIRLQICSSPPNRMIQLTGYLDSTDHDRVEWKQVSKYPVISNAETGLITDSYFHENGVYTYQYTLLSPEYSGCGSTSARVYIRAQRNRISGRMVDTITICSALVSSRSVNLNHIFGLELGGEWTYPNDDPGCIAQNNITPFVSPSKYAGAMMFNAQKAYAEAETNDNYSIIYKGTPAKKFDFVYAAPSCVTATNATKQITLIVTE
jgi:uncharacterized repeat protein (TIGR01451 family)